MYFSGIVLSQPKRTSLTILFTHSEPSTQTPNMAQRPLLLTALTTANVIAAAGLPSNFRYATIAQILTAQALRRALIAAEGIN